MYRANALTSRIKTESSYWRPARIVHLLPPLLPPMNQTLYQDKSRHVAVFESIVNENVALTFKTVLFKNFLNRLDSGLKKVVKRITYTNWHTQYRQILRHSINRATPAYSSSNKKDALRASMSESPQQIFHLKNRHSRKEINVSREHRSFSTHQSVKNLPNSQIQQDQTQDNSSAERIETRMTIRDQIPAASDIDIKHLTNSVMREIDRKYLSFQERTGRV
jgi:hypothetical protein